MKGYIWGMIHDNKIMLTVGAAIMLGLVLLGCVFRTSANAGYPVGKTFRAIEIQKGDTLLSIANEYADGDTRIQDYITEVKQINHIHDDRIHSGCYLVIPVYSHGLPSDPEDPS